MNATEVLLDFLKCPLNSADEIFAKFSTIPTSKIYKGNKPGERFLFVQGNREDAATLVAHADTVFNYDGLHEIIEDGDFFRSNSPDYGIGADDRAGCAMLWLLKDLGHHLLICDYEESTHVDAVGNCTGSKYLMREHPEISQIINYSSFIFEFDRRLAFGTRKEHYTTYDLPVSQDFRDFIHKNTGFIDDDNTGYTDIRVLCKDVCGANICVGYTNAHSSEEKISISAFNNTYQIMLKLLSKELKRFSLIGKETNEFFPPRITPAWLKKIAYLYHYEPDLILREKMKNNIKEQMKNSDIKDIMKNSLYYSGCGNDISPITFFEKHIHSYIYCLDLVYNLGYDNEFESVKKRLKDKGYKKRVNINISLDFLINNGWINKDEWFIRNSGKHAANWSIWEHKGDFFSLLFIASDPYTLWKNMYDYHGAFPKVFFYQGFCDSWKGGLGGNENGDFVVNSEVFLRWYASLW